MSVLFPYFRSTVQHVINHFTQYLATGYLPKNTLIGDFDNKPDVKMQDSKRMKFLLFLANLFQLPLANLQIVGNNLTEMAMFCGNDCCRVNKIDASSKKRMFQETGVNPIAVFYLPDIKTFLLVPHYYLGAKKYATKIKIFGKWFSMF